MRRVYGAGLKTWGELSAAQPSPAHRMALHRVTDAPVIAGQPPHAWPRLEPPRSRDAVAAWHCPLRDLQRGEDTYDGARHPLMAKDVHIHGGACRTDVRAVLSAVYAGSAVSGSSALRVIRTRLLGIRGRSRASARFRAGVSRAARRGIMSIINYCYAESHASRRSISPAGRTATATSAFGAGGCTAST